MNERRQSLLLLAAALVAPAATAQLKAAPPPASTASSGTTPATPKDVKLTSILESRSAGGGALCYLHFELPDIPAIDARASRVVVRKAVDDRGTDLVWAADPNEGLSPTDARSVKPGEVTPAPPLEVSARIKNAPRTARVLKEVSGEVEVYVPRLDPNGEATFPRALSWEGKPLAHAALRANGVEIRMLSREELTAERKKVEADARQEATKDGYSAEMVEVKVRNSLDELPKWQEGQIILRVTDPKEAIQEIELLDGKNEAQWYGRSSKAGFRILEVAGGKLKPDWTMKVLFLSEKSLVRRAFVLRNVPLP